MTKKDYERIARVVSATTAYAFNDAFGFSDDERTGARSFRAELIRRMCDSLREDNPRFDDERFRAACLG